MLEILQMFNTYLPKSSDAAIGVDGQLFSGDQLTVERTVNVIASVANGRTPQDRLDWIHLQLGDWHALVKLLSVGVHIGVLELQSSPFKTRWRANYYDLVCTPADMLQFSFFTYQIDERIYMYTIKMNF